MRHAELQLNKKNLQFGLKAPVRNWSRSEASDLEISQNISSNVALLIQRIDCVMRPRPVDPQVAFIWETAIADSSQLEIDNTAPDHLQAQFFFSSGICNKTWRYSNCMTFE